MMMTLKLMGLAFEVHDSEHNEDRSAISELKVV